MGEKGTGAVAEERMLWIGFLKRPVCFVLLLRTKKYFEYIFCEITHTLSLSETNDTDDYDDDWCDDYDIDDVDDDDCW